MALLAAPALAQEKEMPQAEREPTQAEKAAAFDNWLEQATPRIAWRNDTINAIVERMAPQLEQLPEGGTTAADLALGLHRMSDGQLQAANAHQQLLDLEAASTKGPMPRQPNSPAGLARPHWAMRSIWCSCPSRPAALLIRANPRKASWRAMSAAATETTTHQGKAGSAAATSTRGA
ncbi:hypothetical protein ABFV80_000480 [Vandammella animalimorsus]|uniref:hypothetical protein n=1 Tax=Vandammella animalimorsus TaxID=2029117 RepID=UPI00325BB07B